MRSITRHPPCPTCPVRPHNICQGLDRDRQRELYESQQTWEKGQVLYREGDRLGPVFKIISGLIAVSKRLPDGRRQILDFFFPGEIVGLCEANDGYAFEGEAITPVKMCLFSRARFNALVATHADLAESVRATLAWQIGNGIHRVVELGQLSAAERLAAFLLRLDMRYREQGWAVRPLSLPMSRSVIADHLGMRVETLSRAFSELRQLKIINANDTEVTVLDTARLAELADSDNRP